MKQNPFLIVICYDFGKWHITLLIGAIRSTLEVTLIIFNISFFLHLTVHWPLILFLSYWVPIWVPVGPSQSQWVVLHPIGLLWHAGLNDLCGRLIWGTWKALLCVGTATHKPLISIRLDTWKYIEMYIMYNHIYTVQANILSMYDYS